MWKHRALLPACGALVLLGGSSPGAASYTLTNAIVLDPIRATNGSVHPYAGADLAPGAALGAASLASANLDFANLTAPPCPAHLWPPRRSSMQTSREPISPAPTSAPRYSIVPT